MLSMSTPVTLESYAEMRAEMDAGRLRDEVLARTGLSTDEWIDAQRTWLERMGTELDRGRFELTNRYTHAFLERQRALQATTAPPPVDAAAAPLPPAAPAPLLPAPPLPIAAREPLPIMPAPPPPAMAPPMAIPPLVPQPFATTPPEVYLPAPAEMDYDDAQTIVALPSADMREALPFVKGPRGPDNPPQTAVPPDSGAGTPLPFDGGRLVYKDALPFKNMPPAARTTLRSDQEASVLDSHRAPPTAVPPPIVGGGALPFVTSTEAPREAWRSPPPPDRSTPRPGAGALPFLPASTPAPLPEQAHLSGELPSDQPLEAMKRIHGVSLAQYAEICANVTALPEHVVQIRNHYGMDVHAWTALHALWQERFQRDPTLEPRWQALVEAALSRLQR